MPGLAWCFARLFYTVIGLWECAGYSRAGPLGRPVHNLGMGPCDVSRIFALGGHEMNDSKEGLGSWPTCFKALYWKFYEMASPSYAILQDKNRTN